jgi:cob(I)alamin adenosyltransferase
MKIYTKTGDQGETCLLGGVRVSKSHLAIRVCGSVDETNSFIGLARTESISELVDDVLTRIQHDLFDLGSHVAACLGETSTIPKFPAARSTELEANIDQIDGELAPLKAFILPSGSRVGSTIHVARSVCRRAERDLVALIDSGLEMNLSAQLVYLNRLGDLLFVLARYVNKLNGSPETEWNVGRGQGGNNHSD